MRADFIVLVVIALYLLAYKFYAEFIAKKIFKLDNSKITPAHTKEDGVDFLPTSSHILFGHHYASIAGAAPIVGPCIAVYWGWLPALAWVVLGNIFMGALHDMGALFMSVRNGGTSIANIAGDLLDSRESKSNYKNFLSNRTIFRLLVLFLLWILAAAFVVVIAKLFVKYPSSVIPTFFAVGLALVMGQVLYRFKLAALIPSIIALFLLYASIWLGYSYPLDLTVIFDMSEAQALTSWVVVFMVYASIASVLPVWVLLQPRDYINSHQIIVGLGILVLGVFFTKPEIVAPMINIDAAEKPWFPFLFITIACGAISGVHGLVASGTTSKQINKEGDIKPIGYGGMLLEGFLALLAVVAASAGFGDKTAWHDHYSSWSHASGHGLDAFINGAAGFLAYLNLPLELGMVFIAVIIISFASTTLDTLFRVQSFVIKDLAQDHGFKINRYLGTSIAFVSVIALVFSQGLSNLQGAFVLWPLFGATNQLLAALTLLVLALYLLKQGVNNLVALIPGLILTALTLIANVYAAYSFSNQANYFLAFIATLILVLQIVLLKRLFRFLV